jgi:hypothetical protein
VAAKHRPVRAAGLEDPERASGSPSSRLAKLLALDDAAASRDPGAGCGAGTLPLAQVARLSPTGGPPLSAELARLRRPVGPSGHHVLAPHEVRDTTAGISLRGRAVREPGEAGLRHVAVLAKKGAA